MNVSRVLYTSEVLPLVFVELYSVLILLMSLPG